MMIVNGLRISRLMTAAQKKQSPSPTRRRPGRPRNGDTLKINTAHHIQQHAQKLFAEKGFFAVSINDVVAAAQVSKPTLYYYFPDKENLYSAVLTDIIEHAGSYFSSTLTQPLPLREKLIALTEGFFEHAPTSLPCLMRDVTHHLKAPFSKKIIAHYHNRIYQPFETLFETGIRQGELRSTQNARLLTELFLTMLDWLSLRFSFHEGNPLKPHEKAAQVVDLFLEGAQKR